MKYKRVNSDYYIQNSTCCSNIKYKIVNSEYQILNGEYEILNSEEWILNTD